MLQHRGESRFDNVTKSNLWYTITMRRLLAMAVLLAGTGFPLSLDAQRRGAARSFAPSPARARPAFAAVRPSTRSSRSIAPKRAPARASYLHVGLGTGRHSNQLNSGYWPGTPCLTNPGYAGSFFCRQYMPQQGYSYLPGFWPTFWYMPAQYPSEEQAEAPVAENETPLARQVERLTEEVELGRAEQPSPAALPPPAAALQEEPVSTVLVYRDGHQSEVKNYAVLGQTLYVFAGQTTQRIPLADLNLEATQKLNEERGVDFVPPVRQLTD